MRGNIVRRRAGALFALAFIFHFVAASDARQSSPIALTSNDEVLINVNPDQNSISIFNATANTPAKLGEVAVGREPVSVAIHPNGQTAYVANAFDGTVSVVDVATRTVTNTLAVGAEPMGVAISPNGTRLYVANSSSNTLRVINTATNNAVATIDLSPAGTSPRAIAVTNDGDGDDVDETVFVGMFFGQLRPGKTAVEEGQDDQREGRVVAISAATNTLLGTPNPVVLGPIGVTGFNSNGQLAPATPGSPNPTPFIASTNPQTFTTPTGAFPNQLAAIAIQPATGRAYVVSTGASPNGPLRFTVNVQGLVSLFNTATRTEITSGETGATVHQRAPLNLNQGINRDIASPRLFMSNPVAMAWRPTGTDAWIVVQNSDALVRLTTDANGIPSINAPQNAGGSSITRVDLRNPPGGHIAGKAPRGIAVNSTGTRAYVFNFVSRSITNVDISKSSPLIVGTAQASALPSPGTIGFIAQTGAELFYTGRGPQERMSSESWGSCIACHPNGRSDNITWMFDTGPRQTIPLDGMFSRNNPGDQRILNWSAVRDENHDFELNTRGVSGGRGLIDDDRLFLIIGGASGATPNDYAPLDQFNNVTGAVTPSNDLRGGSLLPNLLTPRRDFGVATLDDDRVFIIGGRSGAGQGSLVSGADAVLEFNPRTNILRRRSSTGFTPRHSLGAAAVRTNQGFRIYAIGGYTSTSSSVIPVNTVQEYNPATDTWRTVASPPFGVAQFGTAVAGGQNSAEPRQLIHVVSGNTDFESTPFAQNRVQRFQADPSGPGTWTNFMVTGLTPRRNHGAATASRGVQSRIFVIGGQNNDGMTLDTVEEYQAQAAIAVLTPHTSLPAPRRNFGITTALSSNQIYVIGGVDQTGADQTAVFEYTIAANPASPATAGPPGTPSGAWVTRGNLFTARRGLGVATPPGVTNFLRARSGGRDPRQDAIATWISRALRSARAPVLATDPAAQAGRTLFGTVGLAQPGFSCATCHGGPKWTRSIVSYKAPPSPDNNLGLGAERVIGAELRTTSAQPDVLFNVGTLTLNGGRVNEIRFNGADISQAINPLGNNGFNIPSLLSVHETPPYFYSGLAQTLGQVLDGSRDTTGGTKHHFVSDPQQRASLIAFLRSIDATTPIFP